MVRASPDGINIKKDNPRYGRLLEIKNPTTREISGIPKRLLDTNANTNGSMGFR